MNASGSGRGQACEPALFRGWGTHWVSLNERTNADDFATLCSALGVSQLQGVEFDATFFGPMAREVDYLSTAFQPLRSEQMCGTSNALRTKT